MKNRAHDTAPMVGTGPDHRVALRRPVRLMIRQSPKVPALRWPILRNLCLRMRP